MMNVQVVYFVIILFTLHVPVYAIIIVNMR